jgi:hypothetical protein
MNEKLLCYNKDNDNCRFAEENDNCCYWNVVRKVKKTRHHDNFKIDK